MHVDAVEADRAPGRLDQPQHRPAQGALAAAGLADQADGRARAERRGRRRRRRLTAPIWRSKTTPADREVHLEAADLEQDVSRRRVRSACVVGGGRLGYSGRSAAGSTAATGPGLGSSAGGLPSTGLDRGCRSAARTRSPCAHGSVSVGEPGIGRSGAPRGASRRGTEASSPPVYGCRGLGEQLAAAGRLDDAARVHHVHGVAHAGDDAEVVGDQHQGGVAVGDQLREQLEDLRLDRHVERGRRLVGDQQPRAGRPAPWRSSPAGASRRRAGAGSP